MKPRAHSRISPATSATHAKGIIDDHTGLERLIFFSDAVFAIAITLLALEIRLPANVNLESNDALLAALLEIWPKYLSYAISFLVIGMYWMSHHRMFRFITRYDQRLIFLNLLLLMAVAFIPFPTSIIGEYGNRTATICYALTMALTGFLGGGIWLHANRGGRLVTQRLAPAEFRHTLMRVLSPPLIFLLSIALAFYDASFAQYSWILIAVVMLILRPAEAG
jgi:uncharacterized membrane protein